MLDEIRKRVNTATPGPWAWNSYSRVDAEVLAVNYDDPKAPQYPDEPRPCRVTGIAFDEADNAWLAQQHTAYEADGTVAWVPAEYGDTATGRHAADAEFIAHARTDIPLLLTEVERLQTAVHELEAMVNVEQERYQDKDAEIARLRALNKRLSDHLIVGEDLT